MWHYVDNGQAAGPVSEEDFQKLALAGKVTLETLVWNEHMENWLPASQTKLAFTFPAPAPAAPGPVRVAAIAAPAASSQPSLRAPISAAPQEDSEKKKIIKTVSMIAGALIGYFAVKLLPGKMAVRIFFGGVAGFLCGLIPYFTGRHKNPKLAKTAMTCSIISGMALGILLALPVAIAFTIVIAVKSPNTEG